MSISSCSNFHVNEKFSSSSNFFKAGKGYINVTFQVVLPISQTCQFWKEWTFKILKFHFYVKCQKFLDWSKMLSPLWMNRQKWAQTTSSSEFIYTRVFLFFTQNRSIEMSNSSYRTFSDCVRVIILLWSIFVQQQSFGSSRVTFWFFWKSDFTLLPQ